VSEKNVDIITYRVCHGTLCVNLGAVGVCTAVPVHPVWKIPVT